MNLTDQLLAHTELAIFSEHWFGIGFKVVLAILCGGLIGLERELKHKPAGLRTNILICLGSCLFTTLSVMITYHLAPGQPGDPGRIAAQVVTGIGFLGGGMIIKSGNSVIGLTTAATIWVVAAIGLCIGLGFPITALIFSLTVLFILHVLSRVDNYVDQAHIYQLDIHLLSPGPQARAETFKIFQTADVVLNQLEVEGDSIIKTSFYASNRQHLRIQTELLSLACVGQINTKIKE